MERLSLSKQLLLLSAIPLLAMLIFSGLLAARTFDTWRNASQIAELGRLISAIEEFSQATPGESIMSFNVQVTGSSEQRLLIPAARMRTDVAVAGLRNQAAAAGLVDPMALEHLRAALSIDLPAHRARFDAGNETLSDILDGWRPATLAGIALLGRLAALSNDAEVSRLILAYNAALLMEDTMLLEWNVRPIAGPDGLLVPYLANGEASWVAQRELLARQYEHLAAPAALPIWQSFVTDPATVAVAAMRRSVLGIVGNPVDATGTERWIKAGLLQLGAFEPVLRISSASLQRAVRHRQVSAGVEFALYAVFMVVAFGLVMTLVWATRRQIVRRIARLSLTMRRLADGDLDAEIPAREPDDELFWMALTLSSFKASLIERDRLANLQAAAAEALWDEKERLRVTLHSIGDGMIVTGKDHCVAMMNAAAESMTGHGAADALGQHIDAVLTLTYAHEDATPERLRIGAAAGCFTMPTGDGTLIRPDGAELAIDASVAAIFGHDGGLTGSITVLHDVTESRMLLNRIRQLAHYDTLTGLPNRSLFHDRLRQAILLAERSGQRCALLFLDMDRFKNVNDTLGHAVGDLLLREAAKCLTSVVRASDTVARLGGDEFVIILNSLALASNAALTAQKILNLLARVDRIGESEVDVSFSIGIAIYPDDASTVDELLMHADAAMYQAKDAGRATFMFFDPEMDRDTQKRNQLRLRLAKAIQLQQFILLYQPKVNLDTGRITGAEALIRWHPEPGEIISPADFIPIAEESGLIVPIGHWVINEACRQMKAWAEQGLPPIPVAINVSMRNLRDPAFLATLRSALAAPGVAPRALEIEITETVAMADTPYTLAILSEVRALGVSVSIDDFGTGFSSLSHLRKLPADTIKIDRGFVSNMVDVEDDAALVRAIIGIATTMRKHVVAEGVETEAQRDMLLRFGCNEAQGYLFSKPVEPAVLGRMLKRGLSLVPA